MSARAEIAAHRSAEASALPDGAPPAPTWARPVAEVQRALNLLAGAAVVREHGEADAETDARVRLFQASAGMAETGVADAETMRRLEHVLARTEEARDVLPVAPERPGARAEVGTPLDPFALRFDRVQHRARGSLAAGAEALRPEVDPRAVEGDSGTRVRRRNEDRLREIASAAEQSPAGAARQYTALPPELRVSLWTVALCSDDAAESAHRVLQMLRSEPNSAALATADLAAARRVVASCFAPRPPEQAGPRATEIAAQLGARFARVASEQTTRASVEHAAARAGDPRPRVDATEQRLCFEVLQSAYVRAERFQHRHANRAEALLDGMSSLVPGSPRQAIDDEARGQVTDELLDRAFGEGAASFLGLAQAFGEGAQAAARHDDATVNRRFALSESVWAYAATDRPVPGVGPGATVADRAGAIYRSVQRTLETIEADRAWQARHR